MQCKSCTPWLASVLCFTNSKTSTASHCILLLPRSRMEIAEKPASRRKKAGFTFSERFGATIGQHPVITFACQTPLIHSLSVVESITSGPLQFLSESSTSTLNMAEPTMVPIPVREAKAQAQSPSIPFFGITWHGCGKQTRMSHMAKSVLCHLFWQAYGFIVEINGAAIRQQLRTIASKGNQGRACMIPSWTA